MIEFILEILSRIRSESPRFFIVLRYFVFSIALLSFCVNYVLNAYSLYPILQGILSHLITACLSIGVVFYLPKEDKPKKLKK